MSPGNAPGIYNINMIDFVMNIKDSNKILIIADTPFTADFFRLTGLSNRNIVHRREGYSDSLFLKELLFLINEHKFHFACSVIASPSLCVVGANFILPS